MLRGKAAPKVPAGPVSDSSASPVNLNTLIQVEILKKLQGRGGEDGDEDEGMTLLPFSSNARGVERHLRQYNAMTRRIETHPDDITREFVEDAAKEM